MVSSFPYVKYDAKVANNYESNNFEDNHLY